MTAAMNHPNVNELRIGILTNHLNNIDGVSKHIFNLVNGLKQLSPSIYCVVISEGGNFVETYKENGIETILMEDFSHDNRNPINFLKNILLANNFVNKYGLTILHSHNHYHANIARAVQYFCKVKTVQTNHGIIPRVGLIPHYAADKLIAVNQHIVDYFSNKKQFPSGKFDFIRCGIPKETSLVKKINSPIKFIAAGRMVKEKGFDIYIKAAATIKEQVTIPTEFLLAGTGDEFTELTKLNNVLHNPVTLLGDVKNLPELFQQTHVLINPSRSMSEGFPCTIVEAVFRDNFLITSLFNGIECDFDKNIDGYAFKVDDEQALIQCILSYLNNREEADQRAAKFSKKARSLFSQQLMAEKTLSLYSQMLE